nr:zinc-binding dehydrogenase [Actinomyces bowdenii]
MTATNYDGPAAMALTERQTPEPGPGQVTVEVSYAGIGFVDGLFASGFASVPLPFVPGLEVAGRVRAVGEGVIGLSVGEGVAALPIKTSGGYAEVVAVDAGLVAPIPEGLDPATAAATCTNTVTALAALRRLGDITGARVLVHAGVGGVGSQFGQVARVLGADRVGAVVGAKDKARAAADLGYDDAYLRADMTSVPEGAWDLVIDPVGGVATSAGLAQLAAYGTLLRIGNASGAPAVPIDSTDLWLRGVAVAGFNLGAWTALHPQEVGADLRRALDLVAAGRVRVEVTRQVPLERAGHALQEVLDGATRGKVVAAVQSRRSGGAA